MLVRSVLPHIFLPTSDAGEPIPPADVAGYAQIVPLGSNE
jgi:hypothetical protein